MELLTPGTGLIIWQFIIFVGLFFVLKIFAWKPILSSLKEREESIQQALDQAEKAKIEMASLKSDNEKLFIDERVRRLGSTLAELGWDAAFHQLAEELPDARERLTYVGRMTEAAAT